MSSDCPPQSPAVAKTVVALEGESPLLAATFAYWDNILGPRVRHIWAPKTEQLLLSDGEITFLANHTLNGEILRSAECGAVDVKFFVLAEKGVIIVSLIFDGDWKGDKNTCALSIILPQTELSFYLPLHRVCVDRLKHIIRKGRIWMHKGHSIISVLTTEIIPIMDLLSSMKSHSVPEEIDMVRTLCLFLTPTERKCSRLCRAESSFRYDSGLYVQGLLKDSTGSFVLPFRQVLYSPYPTTHIDVDVNTVKQMAPCHEHIFNQRRYMGSELTALWKATSDEEMAPDTIIHANETFTPDLNVFQDVMHTDTLVKSFLDQVFQLKPGLSLRSMFLAQFLLVLHRKALTLIKYIEDETQKGKKPFRSLRNLKGDLDLTVEGDLNIVMALAEKLKAGLHSFVFGKSFFTSVQERDVLMSF
ncbi:Protein C9orf72 [Acipenser ruthenus]|uniref:Protein C9orf72 n=1 Tax=Acipenser ruthenus TaxID=7906 RepID=A0A444U0J5_ACIRT|nr:Protein C9orf72 [Acipenser ruthenus]